MNNETVKKNSLLRKSAREQLKGNWGKGILLCFIFSLIVGLPGGINSFANASSSSSIGLGADPSEIISAILLKSSIAGIITLIISAPLTLGLASCFIKLVRKEAFRLENLFDGFQHFASALVLLLLQTLFTFLWSLLLVIPGIIAQYRYRMAFYILNDNPELGAFEALKKSKQMMIGYKWKLFCLDFSFIGWALLSCLTLGIGLLWFVPYNTASIANFYQNLKDASETNSNIE
jgi:uncharacterized membrane protein